MLDEFVKKLRADFSKEEDIRFLSDKIHKMTKNLGIGSIYICIISSIAAMSFSALYFFDMFKRMKIPNKHF